RGGAEERDAASRFALRVDGPPPRARLRHRRGRASDGTGGRGACGRGGDLPARQGDLRRKGDRSTVSMDFNKLAEQAQQMQEQMQKAQEEMENEVVEGTA